jgi:SAM-dependent methyltransferase
MSLIRTAKEVTRDLIAKAGFGRLDISIRKFRGQNVDHLFLASLSERFSAVYENRVWLFGRSEGSRSGLGSELQKTQRVRKRLEELLKTLDTRSLLDVGCGDFTWMKEIQFPFEYIGIDIVAELVAANNVAYRTERRFFQVLDATRDPLPEADTILCREVMFHLSFQDIRRLIKNIRHSGSAFLVATNDNDLKYNADILSGDFRMLNLLKSPFFFPSAAELIPDDGVLADRTLSVWKVTDLPEYK